MLSSARAKNDSVGNGGVPPLANGNFVVRSLMWDGAAVDVGATWGQGATGLVGTVSVAKSLPASSDSPIPFQRPTRNVSIASARRERGQNQRWERGGSRRQIFLQPPAVFSLPLFEPLGPSTGLMAMGKRYEQTISWRDEPVRNRANTRCLGPLVWSSAFRRFGRNTA